ncbi:hypothetical protein [Clostridium lacusfryxellense]|uniref:hypothetical protein n=1 Tax=Clostridium lacusfryxellense TaxID=205328 RepID=UPI001C0A9B03|nr:hypothetical protein [Clostridium lacusfryxellense]MBU3113636.1 hypothetical protein [Clostridium lacusfryxellense]
MDEITKQYMEDIHSLDKDIRYEAYIKLMEITENEVDWAYEVWETLIQDLKDKNNHLRSIAAQLLCNLSKSDKEARIISDFHHLILLTRDERFVTARHCLRSLWKIGIIGEKHTDLVLSGLEERYKDCINEKNCTLIRADIIEDLKNMYTILNDEVISTKVLELLEMETDDKYKKKYLSIWRKKV